MENTKNSLILAGQIATLPSFSHAAHSCNFMRFTINIARLSGTFDRINVLIASNLLPETLSAGDYVEIEGELRSYNNKSGVGNKLVICAYAKSLKLINAYNRNELNLCGTICKAPIYRKTPLGREICDLILAVNRRYGRADYIPVIAWGKNAQILSQITIGESIDIVGRIQSREYIKAADGIARTTYEVSVSSVKFP